MGTRPVVGRRKAVPAPREMEGIAPQRVISASGVGGGMGTLGTKQRRAAGSNLRSPATREFLRLSPGVFRSDGTATRAARTARSGAGPGPV